jgi:hypothetical protein
MTRIAVKTILVSMLVVMVAVTICLAGGCGSGTATTGVRSPAPSPAPSWLEKDAASQAERWGDPHPTAAYWGLLHDPELGRLTASGPNKPSHKAYVIVLVGDYSKAYSQMSLITSPSTPPPPVKWVYFVYATTTHADTGSFGCGTKDFDASKYPSLQPLAL